MELELVRYVVDAVVLEGRSCRDVAAAHGVSKSWVAKVVARFRVGGYGAIVARSRAPHSIPHRTPAEVEDEIVRLRKLLTEDGFDGGAATIQHHLGLIRDDVPSITTIWRILKRRGFVVPQPHKRPRSSWIRFEASLPNQRWQSDMTHWRVASAEEVEIVSFLDDYSRLALASRAFAVATSPKVLALFKRCGKTHGFPASLLTDNGGIYTAAYRHGRSAMESELLSMGILFEHSKPYHPQTCGKVERYQQTLKAFLAKQDPAQTIEALQAQIDRFVDYYNTVRPHRARERMTPKAAFDSRDKARPAGPKIAVDNQTRVRRDRIDKHGTITIRHKGRLHHVGLGRALKARRVIVLVNGLDIRVLSEDGELLRHLELDPSRDYQPTGKPSHPQKTSTMS